MTCRVALRSAALLVALAFLTSACSASTTIRSTAGTAAESPTATPDTSTADEQATDATPTPAAAEPAATPEATASPQGQLPSSELVGGSVQVALLDAGAEPRTELRMMIASSCGEITIAEQRQTFSQLLDGTALPAIPSVATIIETATSVQANGDNYDVRSEIVSASMAPDTDPSIATAMTTELQGIVGLTTIVSLTNRGVQIPDSVRIEGAEAVGAFQSTLESLSKVQAPLPIEPVGVGAAWQTVSIVDFEGAALVNTTDYLVTAIEGTVVTFDVSGTQQIAAGSQITLNGIDVEVVTWTGTSAGQTTIDLATISPITSVVTAEATQVLDFGAAGGLLEQEILSDITLTGEPNEGCTGRTTRP